MKPPRPRYGDTGWLAPLAPVIHPAHRADPAPQIRPVAPAKPPAARSGWISVEGAVRAETEAAVIVRIDGIRSGVFNFSDLSFPRSACDIEISNGRATVSVPLWLAKKKGLSE